MPVECIIVLFDDFYELELIYLANYPKVLYRKWLKITFYILHSLDLLYTSVKAKIWRVTFIYYQKGVLNVGFGYIFKNKVTR